MDFRQCFPIQEVRYFWPSLSPLIGGCDDHTHASVYDRISQKLPSIANCTDIGHTHNHQCLCGSQRLHRRKSENKPKGRRRFLTYPVMCRGLCNPKEIHMAKQSKSKSKRTK